MLCEHEQVFLFSHTDHDASNQRRFFQVKGFGKLVSDEGEGYFILAVALLVSAQVYQLIRRLGFTRLTHLHIRFALFGDDGRPECFVVAHYFIKSTVPFLLRQFAGNGDGITNVIGILVDPLLIKKPDVLLFGRKRVLCF